MVKLLRYPLESLRLAHQRPLLRSTIFARIHPRILYSSIALQGQIRFHRTNFSNAPFAASLDKSQTSSALKRQSSVHRFSIAKNIYSNALQCSSRSTSTAAGAHKECADSSSGKPNNLKQIHIGLFGLCFIIPVAAGLIALPLWNLVKEQADAEAAVESRISLSNTLVKKFKNNEKLKAEEIKAIWHEAQKQGIEWREWKRYVELEEWLDARCVAEREGIDVDDVLGDWLKREVDTTPARGPGFGGTKADLRRWAMQRDKDIVADMFAKQQWPRRHMWVISFCGTREGQSTNFPEVEGGLGIFCKVLYYV